MKTLELKSMEQISGGWDKDIFCGSIVVVGVVGGLLSGGSLFVIAMGVAGAACL